MKLMILLFLISFNLFAGTFPNNDYTLGDGSATTDKGFTFDTGDAGSNVFLKVDDTKKIKFSGNSFQMGDGASANNKEFIFDSTSATSLKWNGSTNGVELNNSLIKLGDGTAADVDIELNNGTGHVIRSSIASGKLEFSNDGALFKKLGSGAGGAAGGVNLLDNDGAEDGTGSWTSSGGTFSQQSYTNGTENDLKYFRLVASASTQKVYQTVTVPDNIGAGCMADFEQLQGDTAFDYKVYADYAGTPDLLADGSVSDLTSWQKVPTHTFPCGAGGDTLTIEIISTAAGTIDFDKAYLGSNKGFISGDKINVSSARIQNNGTASIISQSHDSIASVNRSSAGTIDHTFKAGEYTVAPSIAPGSEANTFNIYVTNITTSGFTTITTSNLAGANTDQDVSITITKQGADAIGSQESRTPEQANFSIDVNIQGADIAGINSTTPTELVNASLNMTLNRGSAKIPCSTANLSSGLTCSAGSEGVGVVFNAPRAGGYKVCGSWLGGTSSTMAYRWVTTLDGSQAALDTGNTLGGGTSLAASGKNGERLCSTFTFNSVGEKVIRLFSTGNSTATVIKADNSPTMYTANINITVEMVSHNVSMPVTDNMMDTKQVSGRRTCTGYVVNAGTPTLSYSSNCIENLVDQGIGEVRLNFKTGVFSGNVMCTCMGLHPTVTSRLCSGIGTPSETFFVVGNEITGGAVNDNDFMFLCEGDR